MAHPLDEYLSATGDTASAFARRIGCDRYALTRLSAGGVVELDLARRIVDATDGAVGLEDLCGRTLADLAARRPEGEALRRETLVRSIRTTLEKTLGAPIAEELASAAAEATADTHAALARVTSRRGSDRLEQALRPVLEEILRDCAARHSPALLDDAARSAARLYFQERPPQG